MPRQKVVPPNREHVWERADFDHGGPEDVDEDPDDIPICPKEAGRLLVDLLLDHYHSGGISAKLLCTICWWATEASCQGPVVDFKFRPDASCGHFARHIDSVLGLAWTRITRLQRPPTTKLPSLGAQNPCQSCSRIKCSIANTEKRADSTRYCVTRSMRETWGRIITTTRLFKSPQFL